MVGRREQGDPRRQRKLGPLVEQARHSMLYKPRSHSNSAAFAIGKQVLGVQSHQLQLRCVEILNQHDEMFIKSKDSELA